MASTIITSATATGVSFGLTQETGILLNSFSRSVQADKASVMDALGSTVAVAYYNKTATISLKGVVNGTATYNLASILTLTNATNTSGVTGGKIVVDSVNEESTNGSFKSITVSATQYPDL